MGFGRERGIEDDLQLSGVRKWVDGEDRHLSGEDWDGNTCFQRLESAEVRGDQKAAEWGVGERRNQESRFTRTKGQNGSLVSAEYGDHKFTATPTCLLVGPFQ